MDFVEIVEVGPRDGLQNEKTPISTEDKKTFVGLLRSSGISKIELTSFVRPDRIPQLNDATEISKDLVSSSPSQFVCLVPNEIGFAKAVECGYTEVAFFTATSESFQKKNANSSVAESLEKIKPMVAAAKERKIRPVAYISTISYCPYEGWMNPHKVLEISQKLFSFGIEEISLGETIGKCTPEKLKPILKLLVSEFSTLKNFRGHFHDTYATAIANVSCSLDFGMRKFDSSSGGLGGCPYAKGASGNLATEDLVYFLETSGFQTGIELSKLVLASKFIETKIGRKLTSKVFLSSFGGVA